MPFEVSYTKHRSRSPSRTGRVRRSKSFGAGDSPIPTIRLGAAYNHHGHRHHHSVSAGLAPPAPPPPPPQPSWSHHFQPHLSYTNTSTALAPYNPRSSTPNMPGSYPTTTEQPQQQQTQQVTRENYWRYFTPSASTALTTTSNKPPAAYEYTAPLKFSKEDSDRAVTQHINESRRAAEINAQLARLHADLESERKLHSLDNSLQQTKLRQQILELELLKAQQLKGEVDAKNRMDSLYQLSQWDNYYHHYQQQQAMAHGHYLTAPRGHRRAYSHGARSRSRGPSGHDERHRSQHQCSRCLQRGHYSAECNTAVLTKVIDYRPARSRSRAGSVRSRSRSRTRSLADWASERGRRGRRYEDEDSYDDDDDYEDDEDAIYYSDDEDVRERRRVVGVRGDSGILVAYSHGGGPGSRRVTTEVRHVVGA